MFMHSQFRKNLRSLLFVAALTPIASNLFAQNTEAAENQLSISAQLRPRLEIRDGAFRPLLKNEKTAGLISERIRFGFDYSYKNTLEVKIVPQTVSIWGQANMVQGAENNGNRFALFEAWSKLKMDDNWSAKLGRQVISLDDERFFGELDWAQGGRAHDALSFQYQKNNINFRSFFAYNQNYKALYGNNLSNPTGNSYSTMDALPYKWMQTLWLGINLDKSNKLSFLFTNLGLQQAVTPIDSIVRYSQTLGLNYNHHNQKLDASIAAYYQGGRNITGTKTNAYMLAGYLGASLNKNWQIGLGSDFVSGNDVGVAQTKNTAFNPYFHTGHKFYGAMDYFYSGNGHKNVGLSDTYLRFNYKNDKGLGLIFAAHQFITPNTVKTSTITYKNDLGQEFDFTISQKLNKFASLSGGYSFYVGTPTLNYLKSTIGAKDYQQWGWLSLNITPTLIKTKF